MHFLFPKHFATIRKIGRTSLIAFFFLSSCVRVGEYRSQYIPLDCTDFSRNIADVLESSSFSSEECDPWWDIFCDPQLELLISQAIACHPSVKIAMERIELAAEEARLIRSSLFPHFNFDINLSRQKLSGTNTLYSRVSTLFSELTVNAVSLFWNLDIWGKNLSLYLARMSETQAAIAEYSLAELFLSLAIATTYYDYQSHLIRLDLARERLETFKTLEALYKKQFQHAIASQIPQLEIDIKVAAMEELVYTLEGEIEVNRHALAALVSNPCGWGCCDLELYRYFPSFEAPFPLPSCLPLDLLARRPEIISQMWWIQSASYTIDSAVASFYPNINLLGYFGLDTTDFGRLFRGKSLNILGEGALSLPLFDAGLRCANLGIAKETLEIAVQEYNQLVLDAVVEVSDWLSLLMEADKKIKAQARAVADSEKIYNLEGLRFEHAISSMIPVLEAKIIYLMQKDTAVQVQLAKLKAAAGLVKAIGGKYG